MAEKTKKSERAHIHITGMTCASCADSVEKGLSTMPLRNISLPK